MQICGIVAHDQKGLIGSTEGGIPWRFKGDFQWFKQTTMGSVCIMGRRTYDDMIKDKPPLSVGDSVLKGRICYVVTSNPRDIVGAIGTTFPPTVEQLKQYHPDMNVFILGGQWLWQHYKPVINKWYVTMIDACLDANVKGEAIRLDIKRLILSDSYKCEEIQQLISADQTDPMKQMYRLRMLEITY